MLSPFPRGRSLLGSTVGGKSLWEVSASNLAAPLGVSSPRRLVVDRKLWAARVDGALCNQASAATLRRQGICFA